MKLLKEKEMILQIEAARRFNMKSSSSLNSTIKKLEQEGKLKRTKVKIMLAKTFTDDLSWEVQRQLVNSYFKVKELKQDQEINHLPQIQNIQIFDIMEMMIQQMRQQNERIDKLENKINAIAQVLSK